MVRRWWEVAGGGVGKGTYLGFALSCFKEVDRSHSVLSRRVVCGDSVVLRSAQCCSVADLRLGTCADDDEGVIERCRA